MENEEEEEELLKQIKSSVESHPNRNYLYYYFHKHPLKLYDDSQSKKNHEEEIIEICSGCSLSIANASKYWCKKCRNFFHFSCAESPTTIQHPFHISHPLSLLQSPPERSCSACKLNIFLGSANSYGCLDCQIFFHDFCLQLPFKLKKHNLHSYHHPLFLISSVDDDDNQEFKCRGCYKACSGFSYSYRKYYDDFQSKTCISCTFSLQTIHEYHEPAVAHVLTIHSAEILDDSTYVCRVCAKEMGELAFFRCDECGFYLHIHCVLQPTFKSPHHRHLLKLTYNHYHHIREEDELICDLCEKTRHPNLPVYQCPEQGCTIVAHCYCALMEENLSIAHKLVDRKDDEISIVVIKDPPITLKSAIARCPPNYMDQLKYFVANKIIKDGNEWSKESLSIEFSMFSSHPAFPEFFTNHESHGIKSLLYSIELHSDSLVTVVGEYTILSEHEQMMHLLFANYGDFSKNSFLTTSVEKLLFFTVLFHAMLHICCTQDENISKQQLWFWLDCFNLVHSVGFKIHFARQRFKKALHSFFGHVFYEDQAMERLDTEMKVLNKDAEDLISLRISTVHSSMTLRMIKESCVMGELYLEGETIKFFEDSRKLDNSWEQYTIETRDEKVPSIRMEAHYILYGKIDPKVDSRFGFMEKIRDMRLWDYHTLIDKIEAFLINKHQKNIGVEDDQDKHLIDIPFNLCKNCDLLVQSGCELLEKFSCLEDYDDHDLIVLPTAPSPFKLVEDRRFHYAIDKSCCICALPIWGSAYMNCDNLTIHKFCVNFPREFHHKRLHPEHTLSLGLKLNHLGEVAKKKCNACGNNCQFGQVYSCESCNFCLEPKCIFRDSMITVSSHSGGHRLMLVEQNTNCDQRRSCSSCQIKLSKAPYLYCGPCDLSYCIRCTLPFKVSYSRHCHELQFNEHYFEDDTGDYYCDACEEPRLQPHPVYRCLECDYVAHIGCAISDLCNN